MQFIILLVALFSAFASALPTLTVSANSRTNGDGRGATLYSGQNYSGTSGAIPPGSFCVNLNNVFFDMDGKARSIAVEQNMYCSFYIDYNCPAGGAKAAFGDKKSSLGAGTLPEWLDRKSHSVYCAPL